MVRPGGGFMVLKAAWDEEFDQPIVYYFDTVAAAAAGANREQLMTDLQHPVVAWSSVTDVVGWINDCRLYIIKLPRTHHLKKSEIRM